VFHFARVQNKNNLLMYRLLGNYEFALFLSPRCLLHIIAFIVVGANTLLLTILYYYLRLINGIYGGITSAG